MTDFVSNIRSRFFRRNTSQNSSSATSPTSPQQEDGRSPSLREVQRKPSFLRSRIVSPPIGEVPGSPVDQRPSSEARDKDNIRPTTEASLVVDPSTLPPPEVTVRHPTPEGVRPSAFEPPPTQRPAQSHPHPPPTPQSQPESPFSGPGATNEITQGALQGDKKASPPKSASPPKPAHRIQLPFREDYFGGAVLERPSTGMSRRKIWVKRPGQSATLVQISEDDLVDDVRDMVMRKYANSLGRTFDAPDVAVRIIPRERSQSGAERTLGPEEHVISTLDSYFPGGQAVDEALIIDVPQKRTPRPSPRANPFYHEDQRPHENGNDYFPPMPISPGGAHSSASHESRQHQAHHNSIAHHPHSIGVLESGQLPPLPSPRGSKPHHRPRNVRQHTSSPTIVTTSTGQHVVQHAPTYHPGHTPRQSRGRVDSGASLHANHNHGHGTPAPPPLPTPPATEQRDPLLATSSKVSTPPVDHRITSPRPTGKVRKSRKQHSGDDIQSANNVGNNNTAHDQQHNTDRHNSVTSAPVHRFLHSSLLDNSVPPINVLIVEDNIINLRLLEAFVKRLKVRWQTAMNGRDAVTKWREGGFHLVLMDIQLPIMSGLEATKEIRRLERVNGVGAFAKTEAEAEAGTNGLGISGSEEAVNGAPKTSRKESNADRPHEPQADDKLDSTELFKSPVIIVALTASSLQSDRQEALAAGCNDFLTKPVNFLWLERKVMEWGCMQALIDYTGWRRWKDFAAEQEAKLQKEREGEDAEARKKREKKEKRKQELMEKMGRTAGGQ